MFSLFMISLLLLDPVQAAHAAAAIVGRPDIAPALIRICRRESNCTRIGVHARDSRPAASSYAGQIHWGHLDPKCQPRGDWRRWGTRGSWGMNAADAWPYREPCYTPESQDVPIIGALTAARMYLAKCDGERRHRWCPKRRRREHRGA